MLTTSRLEIGKVYTPYEFKDGVARFKVENLTSGIKTVAVRYSGDDNYTDAFDTANFTVSKRQSSIDVTVNATTVGNDVIINVTIPLQDMSSSRSTVRTTPSTQPEAWDL